VIVDGVPTERALVDVVISSVPFLGSRALWDISQGREVVLARVESGAIGYSALGAALLDSPASQKAGVGVHIVLGEGDHEVLVALASGQVQ
jgi:hypothetical protein